MAYRDERRCHICGEDTKVLCPSCGNGVCEAHTLSGLSAELSGTDRARAERIGKRVGGGDVCEACVQLQIERSSGPFVPVYRDSDPVVVQMLGEALEDEGFDVRLLGTQNASLLGAGQSAFEQRIEVPEPQAEQALDLLTALLATPEDAGEVAVAPDRTPEDAAHRDPAFPILGDRDPQGSPQEMATSASVPRKRAIAAGLALIFPGAAHIYARRPFFGIWLTATLVVGGWRGLMYSGLAGAVPIIGAIATDLIGGQLAVDAANRGIERSAGMQILEGGVLASLLVGASLFLS